MIVDKQSIRYSFGVLRQVIINLLIVSLFLLGGSPVSYAQLNDSNSSLNISGFSSPDKPTGSDTAPKFVYDPLFPIEEYDVGPGDIFDVFISKEFVGRAQGYISLDRMFILDGFGGFPVANMKLRELKKKVIHLVKKRFMNAEVIVSLNSPRRFSVMLRGEFESPGKKFATRFDRLHEFLNENARLTDKASRRRIVIVNSVTGKTKNIDYQSFLVSGDLNGNPYIEEGDSIEAVTMKDSAQIRGNVVRSGGFEFEGDNNKLQDVVENKLGGFVSGKPMEGEVTITRLENGRAVSQSIKVKDFFSSKSALNYSNFVLRNGDLIFFPSGTIRNPALVGNIVFVTGEVKNPIPQEFKPGFSVQSYIAAAGGLSQRGNFDGIQIYRSSGEKFSFKDDFSVEPGDTIYVPERTFKFWNDHLTILVTFLSLVTTTLAISR